MMNKTYRLGDLIKWFSLVGSIAFSMGAAKKGGMNFLETLHTVRDQNILILRNQEAITEEQRMAREERNSLRLKLGQGSYAQLNNMVQTEN